MVHKTETVWNLSDSGAGLLLREKIMASVWGIWILSPKYWNICRVGLGTVEADMVFFMDVINIGGRLWGIYWYYNLIITHQRANILITNLTTKDQLHKWDFVVAENFLCGFNLIVHTFKWDCSHIERDFRGGNFSGPVVSFVYRKWILPSWKIFRVHTFWTKKSLQRGADINIRKKIIKNPW